MEIADFDKVEGAIWWQVDQRAPFSGGLTPPRRARILETNRQRCSDEWIEINDLEVRGRIGVPENERKTPQKLLVSVRFQIENTFAALEDKIEQTVDYGCVATEVERVVKTSKAHLIEKLVSDLGEALMTGFPMLCLEIELKKFVLPNARYVSVKSGWTRVRR